MAPSGHCCGRIHLLAEEGQRCHRRVDSHDGWWRRLVPVLLRRAHRDSARRAVNQPAACPWVSLTTERRLPLAIRQQRPAHLDDWRHHPAAAHWPESGNESAGRPHPAPQPTPAHANLGAQRRGEWRAEAPGLWGAARQ
ncbi:hypothetical protein NDU88_005401 [Pleurodeles waltl]|uniref:Uncharacterized protein n=1 Tax=Pleurodeles waltl TaxID=8319 RepID=A0AAV7VNE6_PLEWA|nr:hypothetical protein NDU88_005401 [Pleurodeles waltl]